MPEIGGGAGASNITGNVAHDAADSGNPVKIGGIAETTTRSAVADGDRVDAHFDELGRLGVFLAADGGNAAADVDADFGDADPTTDDRLRVNAVLAALAPDGSLDRLRTLNDTAQDGLGQLCVAAAVPGATVVAATGTTIQNSSTRVTLFTPTAGNRIRIIAVLVAWPSSTRVGAEFYFGTGANVQTDFTKAILEVFVDQDISSNYSMVYPDGAGPVGAVDDVLSVRLDSAVAGVSARLYAFFREE